MLCMQVVEYWERRQCQQMSLAKIQIRLGETWEKLCQKAAGFETFSDAI